MRTLRYEITPEYDGMNVERYLKKVHGYSSRTIVKLKHYDRGMYLNGAHTRTIDTATRHFIPIKAPMRITRFKIFR